MREIFINVEKMLTNRQGKLEKREMKVSEARPLLEDIESQRVISDETVRLVSQHQASNVGVIRHARLKPRPLLEDIELRRVSSNKTVQFWCLFQSIR